ncbi:ribonuclease E inhibitor RraA/Dimethylmenaquinone methyltransferase [Cryomyces antarcticus]
MLNLDDSHMSRAEKQVTRTRELEERRYNDLSFEFTACEVADALLKLGVPKAGFLADINQVAPRIVTGSPDHFGRTVFAPASTVLFVPKDYTGSKNPVDPSEPRGYTATPSVYPEPNIPQNQHWVDLTETGTIVIISQPKGQECAVLGGIMATKIALSKTKGVVVDGRVRDLEELRRLRLPPPPGEDCGAQLPIWARGTSIVGAAAEAKAWAVQVPVVVGEIRVCPGDMVLMDEGSQGIVVIPQDKLEAVKALVPSLREADRKVTEDVAKGVSVKEAMRRHRG